MNGASKFEVYAIDIVLSLFMFCSSLSLSLYTSSSRSRRSLVFPSIYPAPFPSSFKKYQETISEVSKKRQCLHYPYPVHRKEFWFGYVRVFPPVLFVHTEISRGVRLQQSRAGRIVQNDRYKKRARPPRRVYGCLRHICLFFFIYFKK